MITTPWKFESNWKTEDWFNQATLASFLASTGTLYISDIVRDNPTTYFVLSAGTIELWSAGALVANWDSITPIPPGSLEGVPMGLLLGLTYPA